MGSITRLRLPAKLEIPAELSKELQNILGPFEVERSDPFTVDLHRSYTRRVESLDKAMVFIRQSLIPSLEVDHLTQYLEDIKKECVFPKDSSDVNEYQKTLVRYAIYLINFLNSEHTRNMFPNAIRRIQDKKEIVLEILNKAEQYMLLREDKAPLATVVPLNDKAVAPLNDKEDALAIIYDKPFQPFSQKTLKEFKTILSWSQTFKGGILPSWFTDLSLVLQRYIYEHPTESPDPATIKQDLEIWKTFKKDNTLESPQLLIKIFGDFSTDPQQISDEIRKISSELDSLQAAIHRYEISREKEFKRTIKEIKKLPAWYIALVPFEQTFLVTVLEDTKIFKDFIPSIPSRLRTIPGLANAGFQYWYCYTAGKLIQGPVCYRASHIASRDVLKNHPSIAALHSTENLDTLMKTFPIQAWLQEESDDSMILMQTLISPEIFPSLNKVNQILRKRFPDQSLHQELHTVIQSRKEEESSKIFFTNHPLNLAKYTSPTKENDSACTPLLRYGRLMTIPKELKDFSPDWDLKWLETLVLEVCASLQKPQTTMPTLNNGGNKTAYPNHQDASLESFKQRLKEHIKGAVTQLDSMIPLSWQHLLAKELFLKKQHIMEKNEAVYDLERKTLKELLDQYERLLKRKLNLFSAVLGDAHGREIFLCSLEQLITTPLRIRSMGSCVSGKDRKGIQLLHTSAMWFHQVIHNAWPNYEDEGSKRKNFANICARLYLSRHAQEHAGQNAPGADGIKTPSMYWPRDIAKTIKEISKNNDILDIDERLAENNELSRLTNPKKLYHPITPDIDRQKYIPVVNNISTKNVGKIINLIKIIIEEPACWGPSIPTGIQNIHKILSRPGNDSSDLVDKLTEIFLEAQKAISKNEKSGVSFFSIQKSSMTEKSYNIDAKDFYTILNNVCQANDQNNAARTAIKALIQIKNQAFQENQKNQSIASGTSPPL